MRTGGESLAVGGRSVVPAKDSGPRSTAAEPSARATANPGRHGDFPGLGGYSAVLLKNCLDAAPRQAPETARPRRRSRP